MVPLDPVGTGKGSHPGGFADQSFVDEPAAGLNSPSQKGIRRIAHIKPFGVGQLKYFFAVLESGGERFF